MVSNKTIGIISAMSGIVIAIASVILIVQANETAGALDAINRALDEGRIGEALSILLQPQQITPGEISEEEIQTNDEPSFFERLYGGG